MIQFKIIANATFSANDIDDAFQRLADHFQRMADDSLDAESIIETGTIEIRPVDK